MHLLRSKLCHNIYLFILKIITFFISLINIISQIFYDFFKVQYYTTFCFF